MTEQSPRTGKVGRSLLLIAAVLIVGAAVGGALRALRVDPPRREVATLPPLVESMIVQSEDVVEEFVGYGSAHAVHSANVAAEVAAMVVERVHDIRAGSVVAKGQVLLRLDDREYRHVLERAKARAAAEQAALDELAAEAEGLERLIKTTERELRVARDEWARLTDLFERELAAKKEYDFANLAYSQTQRILQEYQMQAARISPRQARLAASVRGYQEEAALAQLNIERCEIKAPFDGRIERLPVDVGDRVAPGAVVLTLIDPSQVEIPIRLPAAVYHWVVVGAPCRVESENMPGTSWHGKVARIGPAADEQTRTFAVYVMVDNTQSAGSIRSADGGQPLIPGMFVRARVRGPLHRARILLPRRACRDGRVFVVEEGIARLRSVISERFLEDRALVSGDVRSGDRVILSHLDRLVDGSPVRTRPSRSAVANPPPSPLDKEGLGGRSQPSRLDTSP